MKRLFELYLVMLVVMLVLAFPALALAETSAPVVMDTNVVTPNHGVSLNPNHNTFYAVGRHWIFWNADEDLMYSSTVNGLSAITHTLVSSAENYGNEFSLWYDKANNVVHYVRDDWEAGPGGFDQLVYRAGTPQSDGTITWLAAEHSVLPESHYRTYGGVSAEAFAAVDQDDSYIYAVGETWSEGSGFLFNGLVVKFDKSDLAIVARKVYGGAVMDAFYSVTQDTNYVYAAGYATSEGQGASDALLVKFNKSDLSIAARKIYGGAWNDQFISVTIDDTHVYTVGFTGSEGEGDYDCLIMKFNSDDLSSVTGRIYGGAAADQLRGVVQEDNYVYAVGNTASDGAGGADGLVMKLGKNLGYTPGMAVLVSDHSALTLADSALTLADSTSLLNDSALTLANSALTLLDSAQTLSVFNDIQVDVGGTLWHVNICTDEYGYPWVAWVQDDHFAGERWPAVVGSSVKNGTFTANMLSYCDYSTLFNAGDHDSEYVSIMPLAAAGSTVHWAWTDEDISGGPADGTIALVASVYNEATRWGLAEMVVNWDGLTGLDSMYPYAFSFYDSGEDIWCAYEQADGDLVVRVRLSTETWGTADPADTLESGGAWLPTISGYQDGEDLVIIANAGAALAYTIRDSDTGLWSAWSPVVAASGGLMILKHVASYRYYSPLDFSWEEGAPMTDIPLYLWWMDSDGGADPLGYYEGTTSPASLTAAESAVGEAICIGILLIPILFCFALIAMSGIGLVDGIVMATVAAVVGVIMFMVAHQILFG